MQQPLNASAYGRNLAFLITISLNVGVQIYHLGPVKLTLLVAFIQVTAMFFGAAPGTFSWLILSRRVSNFPNRRRWDGAMHNFVAATVLTFLVEGPNLSDQFLACNGWFLLICYGSAKLGCVKLACCGWTDDLERAKFYFGLQNFIRLQRLESTLSFIAGAAIMAFSIDGRSNSSTVFFISLSTHLILRQFFEPGRARL